MFIFLVYVLPKQAHVYFFNCVCFLKVLFSIHSIRLHYGILKEICFSLSLTLLSSIPLTPSTPLYFIIFILYLL